MKNRIPTLIGMGILVIGVALGVILVQNQQIFKLGAAGGAAPKDVRVGNITDSSLTVSWLTDSQTSGFVSWGESQTSLSNTEQDEVGTKNFTHEVTIRSLRPQTTYFLKINSAGDFYDNNGVPWQTKTGPSIAPPAKSIVVSGSVLTASGAPYKNSLVYISVAGSLLSTVTSQNGTWVVPISLARTVDLSNYASIDEASTLLDISVQAGPDGVSTAQIYPQSAKPAPPIILGQTHDFRNLPASTGGEAPKAEIGVPNVGTPSSGFNVPQQTSSPSSKAVTLKSLNEGEVVTSTKPEFFGSGPSGTTISIKVESEAVSGTAKVSSSGDWKWSPTQSLSEGIHKITITWKDASGITRTLTRTFIVQAGEAPAFESSPSGSPTSSPTGTPVTTPTSSPSGSPRATSTTTPSATPIQPVSGSLTPTLILSIMGIGILAFSFFLWKKAEI